MRAKARLSNLELLRLIAMFEVLIVHSDFGALGFPTQTELTTTTAYCVIRTIVEMLAVVSVNVFVLISGWFGITFRWRGLCNLLFQCGFFFFGIYFTLAALGYLSLSNWTSEFYKCLMLSNNAWFVKCYIGLFIFAPVLNAFVEKANRKDFKSFLICFFLFQSLYGWFSNGAQFIEQGYSVFSFMGLYLLARYLRIYKPKFIQSSASKDFVIYTILSLTSAVLFIELLYIDKPSLYLILISYTCPLVIAAAVYLLIGFTKLPFTSKAVNKVAASCFAVYLFHFNIFPTFMRGWIQGLGQRSEYLNIVLLLLGFFAAAILIDQIRLLIWNKLLLPRFHD